MTPKNMDKIMSTYLFIQSQSTSLGIDFCPVFNDGCSLNDYQQMAYYAAQLFDFLCTQENSYVKGRPFSHFLSWLKCGEPIECEMGTTSDSDMNKKTYTVHKKGDIITTKIDVPTSFFLIIVGAVGIIVSLYKAVKAHFIRLANEKDNS